MKEEFQPLTVAEENYLKGIYLLSEKVKDGMVFTNSISEQLSTKPASVTDMLKRLANREYVTYEKYYGAKLTPLGIRKALEIIRRHRLWECFLVNTLNFRWDEVHIVAEQLEHVNSPLLTERLDEFLGHPKYDPHGDPIPSSEGVVPESIGRILYDCPAGESGIVIGVLDSSTPFLHHLDALKISLGLRVIIAEKSGFDGSMVLLFGKQLKKVFVSEKIAKNIVLQLIPSSEEENLA
ncbi:MAG: metal-dependent transcriptional regulator [Cytophagales bacterium]|nr:MAG: metal-dependent transcriptional regulator [Cytophagales bacterium]TAF60792.1 MAG: metal-dependent transcriptional regulator [Cytophagales bacterium]